MVLHAPTCSRQTDTDALRVAEVASEFAPRTQPPRILDEKEAFQEGKNAMTDPIHRLTVSLEPAPAATPSASGDFRSALDASEAPVETGPRGTDERGSAGWMQRLGDSLRDLAADDQRVERALRRARRGGTLEPGALLMLQTDVYRYTQSMELASKLVDKATSAVKKTLQSQQ